MAPSRAEEMDVASTLAFLLPNLELFHLVDLGLPMFPDAVIRVRPDTPTAIFWNDDELSWSPLW